MKTKIFFLIPNLAGGGAERVFTNLVKNIDKERFEVTLIYLSDEGKVYDLPEDIRFINLQVKRVRKAPIKLLKLIRCDKPDLIVSTLAHMNMMLLMLKAFLPKRTKIIVRQTNIHTLNSSNKLIMRYINKVTSGFYKKADKIICQSKLMKDDFIKYTGVKKNKVVKIFNPVDLSEILSKAEQETGCNFNNNMRNIFFVGRFNQVKRVPLIINAFENYHNKNNNSRLFLIGKGPTEEKIRTLIKEKGLTNKIIILGFQSNPYKWLRHADLFLLASKHEGMPNALIEAIALNIPVLVLKHPGGTRDIMEMLDIEDRFVDELVIEENSFNPYSTDVMYKLVEKFGSESVLKQYEYEFESALMEGGK